MATKDYKNSKIYCIRNTINDDIYIGSTTQPLSKRMVKHRCDVKTRPDKMPITKKMYELGVEHFYIELVEEYPCESVEQLRRKEGEWVRKMGTLNQVIPGRTKAEYRKSDQHKQYLERNKDAIKKSQQDYHERNRTEVNKRSNVRYHANKETIYEKYKEWKSTQHTCECGVVYTNCHKARHIKSKFHQTYLTNTV